MKREGGKRDLVVLTACSNAEHAIRGILSRRESIGIRPIDHECFVHPERDPGCFLRGHDFLRPFASTHRHALVVMDHEGSGHDHKDDPTDMEARMEANLRAAGWDDRAAVVVIAPELDVWMWNDSPHVEAVLSWAGRSDPLPDWLLQNGYVRQREQVKPDRPKEALEAALKVCKKPRSSALYQQMAEKVSLARCQDRAFVKLRSVLGSWFPRQP